MKATCERCMFGQGSKECCGCTDHPTSGSHFVPDVNYIDMSPIVGSNILCQFCDAEGELWQYGFLDTNATSLGDGRKTRCVSTSGRTYNNVRVAENYIHNWGGGKFGGVLPHGLIVRVFHRGGNITTNIVESFIWEWNENWPERDIIAFEVVGQKHGWEYDFFK